MVFHDLEQVRYCKSSWSPALCEFLGINCKYFSFNRPKKVILRTVGKCRVLSENVGNCRTLSENVGKCRGATWGGTLFSAGKILKII